MRAESRQRERTAAAVLAATVPAAFSVLLRPPGSGDYSLHVPAGGDNAAPALAQLAHLHLAAAAAAQPMMGLTSLLLRAPAVAAAAALGHPGGYALGTLLCLLPLAIVLGRAAATPILALAGCAVLVVSPAVREALASGHPEEVLTATLAAGAVLAADRDREILAGACVGLAAGTKQWGLIAIIPVLWALPDHRTRLRAIAAALLAGVATLGVLPLLDPAAFVRAAGLVGGAHTVNVASLWWLAGHHLAVPGALQATSARALNLGRAPALLLGVGLTALGLHVRGRRIHPLALLAILAAARGVFDPWDLHYYWVAVLVPAALLETAALGRVPLFTLALVLALRLDFTLSLGPVERVLAITATAAVAAVALARASRAAGRPGRASSSRCSRPITRPMAAIAGLAGLLVGSFLNVVAHRLPLGISLVRPRSRCPHCLSEIKPYDNVPVLGWLMLRGRCRGCQARISPRYPIVEAVTAALAVAVVAVNGRSVHSALGLVLLAFLVPITLIDLDHKLIPNKLTLPAAIVAVLIGAALHPAGVPEQLIAGGGAALFLLVFVLAYPGGMGMGDVKLAGVLGLFLGRYAGVAILVGVLAGTIVGATVMARVGVAQGRKTKLPFGPFLAFGAIVAMLAGPAIVHWYLHTAI